MSFWTIFGVAAAALFGFVSGSPFGRYVAIAAALFWGLVVLGAISLFGG